jgi:hypothetical protein
MRNSLRFAVCVALFTLQAFAAQAFDESINFQPGLNLYGEAATLTDLISPHGSQLCAPISITHGMTYLKYGAGYTSLATVPDMDHDGQADTYRDKIRYFFQACGSDVNSGTHYHEAEACMRSYVQQSGYNAWAYIVGPHAIDAPAGSTLPDFQHNVRIEDVRAYLSHRLMVVMGVGWYDYNPATRTYTRIGGHFFNLYGYDYSAAWGEDHITLKAVNSLVDYTGRARENMYDSLEMTAVPNDGTQYPSETGFILTGPGFNFVQKTLVEDLFVVLPLAGAAVAP